MLFRRSKKKPRTCAQGHPQEPTWDKCPFCTADEQPGGSPAAEPETDTASVTQVPDPGRGAVVVAKKKPVRAPRRILAGWLVAIGGEHEGQDFRVHVGKNVLGKGAHSDIALKDAYISERHATFESKNGECTVTDLGSRNGTFVNGQRITGSQAVRDGDRISLGHTELKFRSFE